MVIPGSCGYFHSSFSPQADDNLTKRATDSLPGWRLCQNTTTLGITAYLMNTAFVNSQQYLRLFDYFLRTHQKRIGLAAGWYPPGLPHPSLACRCATALPDNPLKRGRVPQPAGAGRDQG